MDKFVIRSLYVFLHFFVWTNGQSLPLFLGRSTPAVRTQFRGQNNFGPINNRNGPNMPMPGPNMGPNRPGMPPMPPNMLRGQSGPGPQRGLNWTPMGPRNQPGPNWTAPGVAQQQTQSPWAPGEPRWVFPSSPQQWMNSCQRTGCRIPGTHCVFWRSMCPSSVRRVPCRCERGCRVDRHFIPFGTSRVVDACNNVCRCTSREGVASCTSRRC